MSLSDYLRSLTSSKPEPTGSLSSYLRSLSGFDDDEDDEEEKERPEFTMLERLSSLSPLGLIETAITGDADITKSLTATATDSIGGMAYGLAEIANKTSPLAKSAMFGPIGKALVEQVEAGEVPALTDRGDRQYSAEELGERTSVREQMELDRAAKIDFAKQKAEDIGLPGGASTITAADWATRIAAPMVTGFGIGGAARGLAGAGKSLLSNTLAGSVASRTALGSLGGAIQAVGDNPDEAIIAAPFGAALGAGGNLVGEGLSKFLRSKTFQGIWDDIKGKPLNAESDQRIQDLAQAVAAKKTFDETIAPEIDDEIRGIKADKSSFYKSHRETMRTFNQELEHLKEKKKIVNAIYERDLDDLQTRTAFGESDHRDYKANLGVLKERRARDLEQIDFQRKKVIEEKKANQSGAIAAMNEMRQEILENKTKKAEMADSLRKAIHGEHGGIELPDDLAPDPRLTPKTHWDDLTDKVNAVIEDQKVQHLQDVESSRTAMLAGKGDRLHLNAAKKAVYKALSYFKGGEQRGRIGGPLSKNSADFLTAKHSFKDKDAQNLIASIPQRIREQRGGEANILAELDRLGNDRRVLTQNYATRNKMSVEQVNTMIHKAVKYNRLEMIDDDALRASVEAGQTYRRNLSKEMEPFLNRNQITAFEYLADSYQSQSYRSHYYDDPEEYMRLLAQEDPAKLEAAINRIVMAKLDTPDGAKLSRQVLREQAIAELKGMMATGRTVESKVLGSRIMPSVRGDELHSTVKKHEAKFNEYMPGALADAQKRQLTSGARVTQDQLFDSFLNEHLNPRAANRVREVYRKNLQEQLDYQRGLHAKQPGSDARFYDPDTGSNMELFLTHTDQQKLLYEGMPEGPMYRIMNLNSPSPQGGGGTVVINRALDHADATGIPIAARAVAYGKQPGHPDQKNLEAIYEKFGFKKIPSPTTDSLYIYRPNSRITSKQKERLFREAIREEDFPSAVREALGEVKDHDWVSRVSNLNLAHDVSTMKMFADLKEQGMQNGLIANAAGKKADTWVPINGENSLGLFDGEVETLYAAPEMAQILKAVSDRTDQLSKLMQFTHGIRYGKVLSGYQTVRNFLGAGWSYMANGHMMRDIMHPIQGFQDLNTTQKIVMHQLLAGGGELPEAIRNSAAFKSLSKTMGWDELMYKDLSNSRKSVSPDDIKRHNEVIQTSMDMMKRNVLEGGAGQEMMALAQRALSQTGSVDTNKVFSELMDLAGRFYQSPDVLFKTKAYLRTVRDLTSAEGLKVPTEAIKDEAARLINASYQTYSLTPELAKVLTRNPLTAGFTSFPIEAMRNQVNMIGETGYMINKSRQAFEQGNIESAAKYLGLATNKALGIVTGAVGVKMLVDQANERWGLDDKALAAIREFTAYPGQKGGDQLIIEVDKDKGEVTYLDIGNINPHAMNDKIIRAMSSSNPRETQERLEELLEESLNMVTPIGPVGDRKSVV